MISRLASTRVISVDFVRKLLCAQCLLLPALAVGALSVTQPTASTTIAAGDDYATQILGNAWDMNDVIDIDTEESLNVTSQNFGSGVFSGVTTAADANVYPLFEGQLSSINLSRGANFPVDTSRYRYFTVKMKATQPGAPTEFSRLVFYQVNGTFGLGAYHALPNNAYIIFTNDMMTQIDGSSPHQWSDFPQVTGLRVDPATPGGAFTSGSQFSIEWIRLTSPATAGEKTPVAWTDSGSASSYSIIAVDNAGTGASYILSSTVPSGMTTFLADTSFLAPGQYQIQVKRNADNVTANSATFRINSPPQITMNTPNVAGDVTRDFASSVTGNSWGPFSATDFAVTPVAPTGHFNLVSYPSPTTPPGTSVFYGRPVDADPQWFLNLAGHVIDTSIYRSLCFDMLVYGPRDFGAGAVARIFWGNGTTAATMSTSQDIVLDDNLGDSIVNQYCIRDLAAVPLEPNPNGGAWSGTKSVLRIDPNEFTPSAGCSTSTNPALYDTCHDIRLDKVTLSPFARTNPGYTFQWSLTDANASDAHLLRLYLDPDTIPFNGNEILVYNSAVSTGAGQYAWPGSPAPPLGTYNVMAVVDDPYNEVVQYAGGPLVVSDEIFRNGFQ